MSETQNVSSMLCVRCGKGWPKGMSGAASSIEYPGRMQHFPNCPGEEYKPHSGLSHQGHEIDSHRMSWDDFLLMFRAMGGDEAVARVTERVRDLEEQLEAERQRVHTYDARRKETHRLLQQSEERAQGYKEQLETRDEASLQHEASAARLELENHKLKEQLATLTSYLRDEADAGLQLPQPIRQIVGGSNPASESPGRDIVRTEREREAVEKAHYTTRHDSSPAEMHPTDMAMLKKQLNEASSPANRHFDGTAAQAAAYQRVHEHYASDPASEPEEDA